MPHNNMKSVDARRFSMVPRSDVPRSAFDVNHTHKTTFPSGYLIPVFVDEVLPGDTFNVKMHAFARLATAIVPVMDNLILESFFFFVPNRLIWGHWERFMGQQDNPTDSTDFVTPQVVPTWNDVTGTLYDYMGVTLNGAVAGSVAVNALPFRAYNFIWNEWFRDEDLQTRAPWASGGDDGPDTVADYVLRRRGKRHDYFTSARPWPAKPVMQPSTGQWIFGDELSNPVPGQNYVNVTYNTNSGVGAPITGLGMTAAATTGLSTGPIREPGGRVIADYSPSYLPTDLRLRTVTTDGHPDVKVLINDIRTANMLQQWMEKNARGGTRYTELVRTHFGVISPDARLQRPEYLGGGRSFVNIHPVQQTSATGITGGSTVLGEQSATGTFSAYGHGFSSSFTEHGIILGLLNIRSDMTYQQGIRRMFFRKSKFDYYWPQFNGLGEQAIFSKEIFSDGTAGDDTIFGYQERFSEYKYHPNRTSSVMRSSHPTPLDMWHFGQEFSSRPVLNPAFIEENPPVDRALIVASFAEQQFLIDMLFSQRMVRAMPIYSIPGMGGRF